MRYLKNYRQRNSELRFAIVNALVAHTLYLSFEDHTFKIVQDQKDGFIFIQGSIYLKIYLKSKNQPENQMSGLWCEEEEEEEEDSEKEKEEEGEKEKEEERQSSGIEAAKYQHGTTC